ncbi:MAG: Holliday junction branch migration protein RuvA [Bacteroidota bacterium]
MYEYLQGKIAELKPTNLVLDCNGTGYMINISLNTYSAISDKETCRIFVHQVIREDAHLLFGFATHTERDIFRALISVSGIGANTARMMLSSLTPEEIQRAIMEANVLVLKNIKGIGVKTAERVIVDLRDKVGKIDKGENILTNANNTIKEEALSALVMLGFAKNQASKVVDSILQSLPDSNVEGIVKEALKRL